MKNEINQDQKNIDILHGFVEQEDDLFVAHCIENGVSSQGVSSKEALTNLEEAVSLYEEEMFGRKNSIKIEEIPQDSETSYLFKGENGRLLRKAIKKNIG